MNFKVKRTFIITLILYFILNIEAGIGDRSNNMKLFAANLNNHEELKIQRRFITPNILKNSLNSENLDQIITVLNDIKGMDNKGQIFPVIQDLWNLDLANHPTVPPKIAMEPIIRVHLADILMQAYKNGEIEINTSELHDYISGVLSSSDTFLVIDTIIILALFDRESDVDKLIEFSKKKKYFRPSVISLGSMCNSYAGKGLEKILKLQNDPEARSFIKKVMEDRLDESESTCKFWFR